MVKLLLFQHINLLIYIIFFMLNKGGLSSGIFPTQLELRAIEIHREFH